MGSRPTSVSGVTVENHGVKVLGVQQVQIALWWLAVLSSRPYPRTSAVISVLVPPRKLGAEQGRRGNGLNMALSQRAVAVTGKDDLALLGELKEAVDRTGWLRKNGLALAGPPPTAPPDRA